MLWQRRVRWREKGRRIGGRGRPIGCAGLSLRTRAGGTTNQRRIDEVDAVLDIAVATESDLDGQFRRTAEVDVDLSRLVLVMKTVQADDGLLVDEDSDVGIGPAARRIVDADQGGEALVVVVELPFDASRGVKAEAQRIVFAREAERPAEGVCLEIPSPAT